MERLQQLKPGTKLINDWCNFPIPANMEVGSNTVIDSSSCFKKFFSKKPLGLKIGSNVTIESADFATERNGVIEIGDYSYISFASIVSNLRITIGKYVYIGFGVTIVDTDFHPVDPAARMKDTIAISTVGDRSKRPEFISLPVNIEDDVWIGYNATILKGVTIGKGSIIQPGSVVSKSVPPYSVVSGNPGRIKQFEHA
jgi:acetyltransferase-like isoleucine patch superfamily enzyme